MTVTWRRGYGGEDRGGSGARPRRRTALVVAAGVFTATAMVFMGAAGASAAQPTCFGRPATQPGSTTGTPGADVIIGTAAADTLDGRGGDDLICGLGGNDRLIGGPGNDSVDGGDGGDGLTGDTFAPTGDATAPTGSDRLVGGPGDDIITGDNLAVQGDAQGASRDIAFGGADNDQMVGDSRGDTVTASRAVTATTG
jgi:hypothetical protein